MNSSNTDIQCWRGSLSCTLSPGISRCFPSLPQLPWKSLASVVQFYYMWKTTDRYIQQVCRQHVVFSGISKHFQTFCFQQKSPALSTSSLRNDWKQQKQTASWSRCTSLPSEYWWQLSSLLVYKFRWSPIVMVMCFGLLSQRSQRSHDTICIQHQRHNKGGCRGDCCQTLWPQRSVFVSPGFNHGVVCEKDALRSHWCHSAANGMQSVGVTPSDRLGSLWTPAESASFTRGGLGLLSEYQELPQTCSAKWLQLGVGIESSCREQWSVSLLATDHANRSIYATISWADV